MQTGRARIAITGILLAGACGEPAGGRGIGPGIGGSEPRTVGEGDYGPIAQYLVDNIDNPVQPADNDGAAGSDEGAGDDGGAGPACSGFACNDGQCLDASWRCDQITDCAGGEDEANCAASDDGDSGTSCNGFTCDDGQCIDASWQCDQYTDCAGGEDENGCGDTGGDDGGGCSGFACDDGQCLDAGWQCDGYLDCGGGEDEASCLVDGDGRSLVAGTRPHKGQALQCIGQWTGGGGLGGIAAGEAISKGCAAGGVVVGVASGGGGFAAALVCFSADVTQIDAVVGGIFGAVAGLVGGIATCEGDALGEASAMLGALLSSGSIPTYEVEAAPAADAKQCGVPVVVSRSGDEQQCQELHDDMKEFETTQPHSCNVDIGNLGGDPAAIAAACDEIRTRFDNAAKLADMRLAIGRACYDNGNVGPMGNSDFGHQYQWCSVHQAMQRCVGQAQDAKLACDLPQTMAQHFLPAGCGNLLACQ